MFCWNPGRSSNFKWCLGKDHTNQEKIEGTSSLGIRVEGWLIALLQFDVNLEEGS